MIPKVLTSGYNDSGVFPPSEIIPAFSKGLDKDVLRKRASMFTDILPNFERKPGYTYIHLIAVADGCTYGPNSRADFYNGEPCEVEIPHPEKGSAKIIVLDGGISKYLKTFMDAGGVYTEHRNKHSLNPPKSQGYIVAQAYNKPMKRGELIIGVNDDSWHDDLEKLSKGDPLKFSIGFDSVADVCSLCGHVAHTEDEHCDHVKHKAGQWDDDGNAIYMISDQGVYHDISRVRVPAERIAFSIKKVASGEDIDLVPAVNPDALRFMLKTANAINRYNTVKKLAKLEKKIIAEVKLGGPAKKLLEKSVMKKKADDSALDELHKFIEFAHTNEVLGGLKDNRCILTPEEFLKLISPEHATEKNVEIIQGGLPGIFEDLWSSPDLDEFCEDDGYQSAPCVDLRILRPIKRVSDCCSIDPMKIMSSFMSSDLQSEPSVTIICVKNRGNDLSREYASYLTDACTGLDEQEQLLALLRALTK